MLAHIDGLPSMKINEYNKIILEGRSMFTPKKTSISLNKMKFYAHHGVLKQEQTVGNWFEVSISLICDMHKAIAVDDLNGTVNYADVYELVRQQMEKPSALLEHVAGRIINAVMIKYADKVSGGSITVAKLSPPFKSQLESVAVTIEF